MRFVHVAAFLVASILSGRATAGVHVLVNGNDAQLAALVASAADGDTILLQGGGVFTSLAVDAKGLRIVAEGAVPTIRHIQVTNTSAAQLVSVSGFSLINVIGPASGIYVGNCAGSVRFADVAYDPATLPMNQNLPGAVVEGSPDVAFTRCTLLGGNATHTLSFPNPTTVTHAESGLTCSAQSRVALFECTVRGGRGLNGSWAFVTQVHSYFPYPPATTGAHGLELEDSSTCVVSRCIVQGGAGGNGAPNLNNPGTFNCTGPTNGAPGGDALLVSPAAVAHLVGTAAIGGAGGSGQPGGVCSVSSPDYPPSNPGAPGAGSPNTWGGGSVSLSLPASARVTDAIPITIAGTPGAEAILAVSLHSYWSVIPPLRGVLTCGPDIRRIGLGTIPPSGVLVTTFSTPQLAALTGTLMLHVQAVTQDATLQTELGTGQVLSMFDPSY